MQDVAGAEESTMSQLHVVFGAGQIGRPLAQRLLADGHRVRQVTRSGSAAPGAEAFTADLSDPSQAIAAAAGADVVYQVINAPYTKWSTLLEPLQRGALAGAKAAGAHLVVLDNLYAYGVPDGPIRGDSPRNPCSVKGAIRKRLVELLLQDQGISIAIGQAADFVGPDITESVLSGKALASYGTGGRIPVPGDPSLPRAYSFGGDVVAGLAALGADPQATGVWILPTLNTSTDELLAAIGAATGRTGRTFGMPSWLMRTLGAVVPIVREVAEMTYQWEVPYTVDCGPMAQRYGLPPSSLEQVAAAIVGSKGATVRPAAVRG